MRLISYQGPQGPTWGGLTDKGVVDARALDAALPASLTGFIQCCATDATLAARTARQFTVAGLPAQPLDALALLPCVPQPGKIVCLGVNYVDHAKEGGNTVADYPTLFLRCSTSLLAHGAALRVPRASDKLDYEAELAVVVGRPMRWVAEAQVLDHVFGYACFNDASLRDYQRRTTQWTIGKNFDATGGFGPSLVTADELPPGCTGLRIQSRLNGQVMQNANTSDMVFGVARTLSLLSECMTLEPGDVVVMGTPAGVGYARTPPVWMKAGDTIEIDIERVGVLSNPVTA
jgi:2-keto-4-pentenoate hydratase/2-oxohepta-3-ene-1,7-dioic acid hydratase in catechol pathway